MLTLKIKRLHPEATVPKFAHAGDAGMDLYAVEETILNPGEPSKVKTGMAMEIPDGYVGLCWDKSGLSTKNGLKVIAGVIDSGYRGEIMIGMMNLGTEPYKFEKGNKIAQILIQKVESPEIIEVEELSDTSRGDGGFGSTGK